MAVAGYSPVNHEAAGTVADLHNRLSFVDGTFGFGLRHGLCSIDVSAPTRRPLAVDLCLRNQAVCVCPGVLQDIDFANFYIDAVGNSTRFL